MSAEARFDGGQGKMATGALRIALAGNPNCGKTTVFNAYTGARQHVGNYPGVTVDRKEGHVRHGNADITLVDLPGTYSLTAYSMEELVARAELGSGDVQAVINVVDASALERNLLLTVQMMEMGLPVVLVCNMMDEARKAGVHIDMDRLSRMMGIPVVSAVARTGEGLQQALGEAVRLAGQGKRRVLEINYGADIDEGLRAMCGIIRREGLLPKYEPHWIAVKLMEGDAEIRKEVQQAGSAAAAELDAVRRKVAEHIRTAHNISMEAYITDARYGYIRGLLRDGVVRQDAGKDRLALSDKLDKVLTNAFFGPLIMLVVLYGLFYVTIEVGAYPQGWVEDGCAALGEFFAGIIPEGELQSLVVDGIIGGVGAVIVFLPNIMILYLFISFMEDSGYLARAAFIMDRVMHRIGLHGKSFIPLIMGFGCNVPAIMASRTIESRSSRLITILITPFMSCSARIPIYLLLAGTFFAADASLVMIGLYVLGVVLAVVTARLMRRFMFPVDETPFVMELPPYRLPTWKTTLTHMWDKCAQYLRKMGGMILIASMVVWFLSYCPRSEEGGTTAHYENSYLGRLGQSCAPIFSPLGLNWKAGVALLSGVPAKEIVVSTLGVLYPDGGEAASAPGAGTTEIVTGSGEKIEIGNLPEGSIAIIGGADGQTAIRIAENTDAQVGTDTQAGKVTEPAGEDEETVNLSRKLLASGDFTQASALAFLVFILLYFPCIATIAAIGAEAGWKWATAAVVYNTVLAWVVAWAVYRLFMWL